MKRFSIVLLLAVLAGGCGYDPKDPVYDTAKNPKGYPDAAVELLTQVESDQLVTLEQISESFGNLYTEHSDLLDNEEWRDIIDRLGLRLQYKAGLALEGGVTSFTQVGDYYALAAFARPSDAEIRRQSTLFTAWRSYLTSHESFTADKSLSLSDQLSLAKSFLLGDSLAHEFGREYLVPVLFQPGDITPQTVQDLPLYEQAFLAYAGLTETPIESELTQFGNPAVKLVAVHFAEVEENVQRAELYFIPAGTVAADLTVMLRVITVDSTLRTPSDNLRFIPFDFLPTVPTSHWKPGQMAAASRSIETLKPVDRISIGLADRSTRPATFLTVDGGAKRFFEMQLR
jgi:hypothetical protein